MKEIAANRVLELLEYSEQDGAFRWRVRRSGTALVGSVAGTRSSAGYIEIKIDGVRYPAHRLVWLIRTGAWPVGDVDHINGVKDDNRFSNLREATRAQNCWNRKHRKTSASKFKGVTRKGRKWQSMITANGVSVYLGVFDTAEKAHRAYVEASHGLHGEFARAA